MVTPPMVGNMNLRIESITLNLSTRSYINGFFAKSFLDQMVKNRDYSAIFRDC